MLLCKYLQNLGCGDSIIFFFIFGNNTTLCENEILTSDVSETSDITILFSYYIIILIFVLHIHLLVDDILFEKYYYKYYLKFSMILKVIAMVKEDLQRYAKVANLLAC